MIPSLRDLNNLQSFRTQLAPMLENVSRLENEVKDKAAMNDVNQLRGHVNALATTNNINTHCDRFKTFVTAATTYAEAVRPAKERCMHGEVTQRFRAKKKYNFPTAAKYQQRHKARAPVQTT